MIDVMAMLRQRCYLRVNSLQIQVPSKEKSNCLYFFFETRWWVRENPWEGFVSLWERQQLCCY